MHPSTTADTDAPTGAAPEHDVEQNASLAPLLPTYSASATGPEPSKSPLTTSLVPQVVRRMTTELIGGKTMDKKVTSVQRVYGLKTIFVLIQWFFTFWVLGVTAQSLTLVDGLPSVVPMLAYTVTCAAIHIVLMYYFMKANKPVSRTNPQPSWRFLISYGISSLAWLGAMACVILMLIDTLPFDGDKDKAKGLQKCGHRTTYKCYHGTHNAQLNTFAQMNTATAGFITLSIIAQWYQISKLWWGTFTADQIREAYEWEPKKK
ncbi:hypothetical protein ACLOAV_008342 [Pseudogymnoascus australis]